eukprot:6206148-Pleurochrysis_carterae.AAC.6
MPSGLCRFELQNVIFYREEAPRLRYGTRPYCTAIFECKEHGATRAARERRLSSMSVDCFGLRCVRRRMESGSSTTSGCSQCASRGAGPRSSARAPSPHLAPGEHAPHAISHA